VPKQFWRRPGSPTLLESTLARLRPLSSDSRTLIVADVNHRAHFSADWWTGARADVLYQPLNRGTAAGVFVALASILDRDPDALVVFTPSDHGVEDLDVFHAGLDRAVGHAGKSGDIVLCAVEADRPVSDYGWIVPARSPASGVTAVQRFVEKPNHKIAEALMLEGGAWNTMVVVARARVLADLFRARFPEMPRAVRALQDRYGPEWLHFLESIYAGLPARDFSRDLMERAQNQATYVWPSTMGWYDLGTPDRLAEWSARTREGQAICAA
jgi:mannose-1-phosphate guanylyltransferase